MSGAVTEPAPSAPALESAAATPPYAPVRAYVAGFEGARLGSAILQAFLRTARRDPLGILCLALAAAVLTIDMLLGPADRAPGAVLTLGFVALEHALGRLATRIRASRRPGLEAIRYGLALLFVVVAGLLVDPAGNWPLNALMIPVVALAAAENGQALWVVLGAMALAIAPGIILGEHSIDLQRRFVAWSFAAAVAAFGSRQVVWSLQRSRDRLRRTHRLERRRARQLAAVEGIGAILAEEGPTPQALDAVVGLLQGTFGYRFPSIYTWDGAVLRLGASRSYASPITEFPLDSGVIGRVARTHRPAFLPDVTLDPEYVSADDAVVSEIAVPLLGHGELHGVLNVETAGPGRLDLDDLATMKIVADRVGVALALGRERQKLTERARLMDALVSFSQGLGGSLDPDTVHQQVAAGASRVIQASRVLLALRERDVGTYRVVDVQGTPRGMVGVPIGSNEGLSGRAIAERRVLVDDHLERSRMAPAAAGAAPADVVAAMAAPLIAEDTVIGALLWSREDLTPFSDQEREVAGLLAGQVALGITNAELHHATEVAAVTDGLTGLNNRRFFDAVMARTEAARLRVPEAERQPLSAIIFDLDHFGQVNKLHGHRVGDRILKGFADVVRARMRASDLVARYGGEEFVVVLEGTTRIDAMRTAEQIRESFAGVRFALPDGSAIGCTVSAGCSALTPDETSGGPLVERADVALAMAKSSGRNRVIAA